MRVHVPILLGLSANSPFWRADTTGLASTRTPIFRAFPRMGIPPTYKDWEDYEARIEFMIHSRVIEDYTYLWHDVRPHPNFGTVEIRVMDSQTHVEHTLGLAALVQALVRELCEHFDAGKHAVALSVRDARREQVAGGAPRTRGRARRPAAAGTGCPPGISRAGCSTGCASTAQDLGSLAELEAVEDLLERGNGAARQVVVYEANHDLREVVAEIVAATAV